MWNLRKMAQNSQRCRKKLMVTKGERGKAGNWEIRLDVYTLLPIHMK